MAKYKLDLISLSHISISRGSSIEVEETSACFLYVSVGNWHPAPSMPVIHNYQGYLCHNIGPLFTILYAVSVSSLRLTTRTYHVAFGYVYSSKGNGTRVSFSRSRHFQQSQNKYNCFGWQTNHEVSGHGAKKRLAP